MDLDWKKKGVLRQFTQSMFVDTNLWTTDGLDTYGYVYYPYTCIKEKCKIVFFLHGCLGQVNGYNGWDFLYSYGLNDYAASNNLIMVFPQANVSLFNIYQCFDFEGSNTGRNDVGITKDGT